MMAEGIVSSTGRELGGARFLQYTPPQEIEDTILKMLYFKGPPYGGPRGALGVRSALFKQVYDFSRWGVCALSANVGSWAKASF